MTMLRAKRAVEMLLETGRVFVSLPTVESVDAVVGELADAGIAAANIVADPAIDIRELRERLHLTWEQFALRFGLEVDTVRSWETGRREMDAAARSYLHAISNDPEAVERAYAPTPDGAVVRR
jgi:putative transcriptional regulator